MFVTTSPFPRTTDSLLFSPKFENLKYICITFPFAMELTSYQN